MTYGGMLSNNHFNALFIVLGIHTNAYGVTGLHTT